MALAVLLSTSRVAAEATVARLQELAIDAQVVDFPNPFVRLVSGGNYRVRVAVPEESLGSARAELERWAHESRARVGRLSAEVQRVLLGATLAALALGAGLVLAWRAAALPAAVLLWLAWVAVWVLRSRGRIARGDEAEAGSSAYGRPRA